eukprot:GGOE01037236.1.p1 GENE.GGOE01037236.1~~GGOE01037236.1.p1  ORF type:complete len:807 (-),score=158.35 GGOE01037236.1:205-2370(-)
MPHWFSPSPAPKAGWQQRGVQTYACSVVDDVTICKLADLLPELFGSSVSNEEMQHLMQSLDCLRTFVLTARPLQSVVLHLRREDRPDAPLAVSIQCPSPWLCELEVTPQHILLQGRAVETPLCLPHGVLVEAEWKCPECTLTNVSTSPKCEVCGALREPRSPPQLPHISSSPAPAPVGPVPAADHSTTSASSMPVATAPPNLLRPEGPSSPTLQGPFPSLPAAPPPAPPPANAWRCETCGVVNVSSAHDCKECGTLREMAPPTGSPAPTWTGPAGHHSANSAPSMPTAAAPVIPLKPTLQPSSPAAPSPHFEEWECAMCTLRNATSAECCVVCDAKRGTLGLFDAPVASAAPCPSPPPATPLPLTDLSLSDVVLQDALSSTLLTDPSSSAGIPGGNAAITPANTTGAFAEGTPPDVEMQQTVESQAGVVAAPAVPADVAASSCGRRTERRCDCPLDRGVYQKEKHIGRGATGDVFLARINDRQVALKQILVRTAGEREQLLIQAEQYQQLSHPHIIRYEDCFEHRDEFQAYFVIIVMPFFPLGEVTSLLQNTPQVEEKLLLKIGGQVADALRYLHGLRPNPIVHRDLKPENLLWDGESVVLTDLETVRFLDATFVAGATGTYPYQPPEQIDRGVTSEKSDVWALGCVLFAMACKPPFPDIIHVEIRRPDFESWVMKRLKDRQYSVPFAKMLLMMLKVDPARRITAGQVRDHCHQLLFDLSR